MISTLYDKFKPWSEKGSVYLISDTHFDDPDCLAMDPHWISPEEHIWMINQMVHSNDTLIHLGDVGDPEYIRLIKGYKVLLLGNHDQSASKFRDYFNEIYEGPLFIAEKILLSHEPVSLPFALNIHGHDHSGADRDTDECKHINLAANVCGYKPVSLGKIIKDGALSGIVGIHRQTIDRANAKKYA